MKNAAVSDTSKFSSVLNKVANYACIYIELSLCGV